MCACGLPARACAPAGAHTVLSETKMLQPMKKLDPSSIYVLVACEESQAECLAFRERGFRAFSCDLQPCRRGGHPEWHIKGDVSPYLKGETNFKTQDGTIHNVPRWTLILSHPPCTYLCKVGSPWLYQEPLSHIKTDNGWRQFNAVRWQNLRHARHFFLECLNAVAPYVAVENPLPMGVADLPQPTCFASPHWFGSRWQKKTLYWTKNLPPLMATKEYPNPKSLTHCSRGKYRSRTAPELAKAIAQQWGDWILENDPDDGDTITVVRKS